MLLALLELVRGSDMHAENIVAAGEHPVAVDLETLLQPVESEVDCLIAATRTRRFRSGVLATHLLPHCGRNDAPSDAADERAPNGGGRCDAVIAGYGAMRSFLERVSVDLPGPLAAFRQCATRVVYQNTEIYERILRASVQPEMLRDGLARSICTEKLWRGVLHHPQALRYAPRVAAECRALSDGDIPYFLNPPEATASGASSPDAAQGGYGEVLANASRLARGDASAQVRLIRRSFTLAAADVDRVSATPADSPADDGEASPDEFVAAARTIGEHVRASAFRVADGELTWAVGERAAAGDATEYRLRPAGFFLYDGVTGIALLFAALHRVSRGDGDRALALSAIAPVRRMLANPAARAAWAYTPPGIAEGIGSIVYGLATLSRLLSEPSLLDDAKAAADLIDPSRARGHAPLDLHTGLAGAIVALLALHEACGDARMLGRAEEIGRLLVSSTGLVGRAVPQTLQTVGLAHGAAGVAMALQRLGAAVQDETYLDCANALAAWEAEAIGAAEALPFAGWCSGAPGIALARLDALRFRDSEAIRAQAREALAASERLHAGVDHLCCGNAGRLEPFVAGAERLEQPELLSNARRRATALIAHSRRHGGMALFPGCAREMDEPGFFRGMSGIGYQFLRVAHPTLLPSVLSWA
jgi:type 2 lantibiotic biosynthesis protein LanM